MILAKMMMIRCVICNRTVSDHTKDELENCRDKIFSVFSFGEHLVKQATEYNLRGVRGGVTKN